MGYLVTLRKGDSKICRQVYVESDSATIADVIEEARHQTRVRRLVDDWRRIHGRRSLKDWWTATTPPPPPPIPEPLAFDVLVNNNSV